jgi:molybdate-binding protein/DNA-binding XRE family transcriptional regulator
MEGTGMLRNRIRVLREERGYSQAELARRVGVTRQALSLVESGQVVPSTVQALRLARVLGVPVESLFYEESIDEHTLAAAAPDESLNVGDRVLLLDLGGRRFARKVPGGWSGVSQVAPAVGVVTECRPEGQVVIAHAPGQPLQPSVVVAGCDIGLGILTEHARNRRMKPVRSCLNPVWENADNERALGQLARGLVHAAAVHFPKDQPPAWIRDLDTLVRIHFATWQLGWMVRRGNPCGFRCAEDLASGRLRLANRPQGSGARRLLDKLLREAGVDGTRVPGYSWELPGHLQVAEAIANGLADVGIGIASAAALTSLDFLPIQEETCEVWIPKDQLDTDAVQLLCDTH